LLKCISKIRAHPNISMAWDGRSKGKALAWWIERLDNPDLIARCAGHSDRRREGLPLGREQHLTDRCCRPKAELRLTG